MPHTIETIVAMLAVTSIGAVWSSCSPDFGKQGLLDRFGQIDAEGSMFVANGYSLQRQNDATSRPKIAEGIGRTPDGGAASGTPS